MNARINNQGNSPSKLINRDDELKLIDNAFNAILHEESFLSAPIIDFFGITGIGKTRIIKEISERCIAKNVPCIKLDESQNTDRISRAILQQIRKYRQQPPKITPPSEDDSRAQTVEEIKGLLEEKPAVILLDSVDTSNEKLVDWLRMTLRDLLGYTNLFVVLASKQRITFENDWSIARKLKSLPLRPLNLNDSRSYLASLDNTIPTEIGKFIFKWTRGYPLAMEVMTRAITQNHFDISQTEDQQQLIALIIEEIVDNKVFANVADPAQLEWYKAHFLLLSMPRRFNLIIMEELLETFDPSLITKIQSRLEYMALPRQLNANTGVLYWDMQKAAFTVDDSIRNLYLVYQRLHNESSFIKIHTYLADKNKYLADRVTGSDRVRYLREYLYHSAQSLDIKQVEVILQPTLEQIKEISSDAMVQFEEEFILDTELNEILGELRKNVYEFIREHSTHKESPE